MSLPWRFTPTTPPQVITEYFLGMKDLGLTFEQESRLSLLANYSEKEGNKRSVMGVSVTVGNLVVGWWCSSTQQFATLSTTEAES